MLREIVYVTKVNSHLQNMICVCIHIYIYIQRERESERGGYALLFIPYSDIQVVLAYKEMFYICLGKLRKDSLSGMNS
jgi:hypothetical protein